MCAGVHPADELIIVFRIMPRLYSPTSRISQDGKIEASSSFSVSSRRFILLKVLKHQPKVCDLGGKQFDHVELKRDEQVAEEARNAEWLAPIGIAASIVGSWFIGLIYLLALLFSIQSIPSVQQTSFAIPIAQLYYDAVGTRLTLLCLFVVGSCQFLAACTCFTASSRLLYALARDNAIPYKRAFMTLNRFQVGGLLGVYCLT